MIPCFSVAVVLVLWVAEKITVLKVAIKLLTVVQSLLRMYLPGFGYGPVSQKLCGKNVWIIK